MLIKIFYPPFLHETPRVSPQVTFSDFSQMNDGLLRNINFWVFSVGLKLVPCILLTYLSLALIRVLLEAERRRQRLKSNIGMTASHVSVASGDAGAQTTAVVPVVPAAIPDATHLRQQADNNARRGSDRSETSFLRDERVGESRGLTPRQEHVHDKSSSNPSCSVISSTPTSHHQVQRTTTRQAPHAVKSSSSQSDRTTKMLLAILLLYLVTEAPNGIISLLVGLFGESFQNNVYLPLGEIFDILALINSGINFILLASMSRLFRKTFCKIFWPRKYHSHFQRDNNAAAAAVTEKTNVVNHHAIARPNAVLLNQSAPQTMSTTLTNRSYSPQPPPTTDRLIELNKVTSFITVTEPSHEQHEDEDNNETTMV